MNGFEQFIVTLSNTDVLYVYCAVLFIAYIENIIPPLPSDVIVVFAGSLVAIGKGSALITITFALTGSTLGFLTMYWIGMKTGNKVLETGRIKFISVDVVHRVEIWFRKYGYAVIVVNRFLAGTRAVVAFCAGLSEMRLLPTTLLCAVSALLWNSILVYLGSTLGRNWREIGSYLALYSRVVSIAIAIIILAWIGLLYFRFKRKNRKTH